jgi:hypothetical protein|tara:strand:- start:4079 stop:4786 length:708 start_codon:yes stop_codon:yes gene_type:complete
MGLPIQKAPTFRCKLSDGKEVTFRPFLVKEQKYLLLAKEGKNSEEVLNATRELIQSVTNGKVNSDKLIMADLEYLFLQIRSKSIGESAELKLYCQKPGCGGNGGVKVDLSAVNIKFPEEVVDSTIKLSETLGVTLRHLTARQLAKTDDIENEGDKMVYLLKHGIESIYDAETVYDTDDIQDDELTEFVESLTLEQVDNLNTFFENVPSLQHTVEYKCDSCGTLNESTLKGLQSFF